jgi:haloalkane dehalogenase
MIDPDDGFRRHRIKALGRATAYVDEGRGSPVVFLHGNATHSYYWRNAIRYLAGRHRCIAADLPGMGESDPFSPSGPGSYRFEELMTQVDVFLQLMGLDDQTILVGHEFGALLTAHYAHRHPGRIAGLVLIDPIIQAVDPRGWPGELRSLVDAMRGERGEELVLVRHAVVEQYLPMLVQRRLSPFEMKRYRKPYDRGAESARPLLTFIRALPFVDEPGPLLSRVDETRRWLSESDLPKLVVGGDPGHLVTASNLAAYSRWPATETIAVPGLHFLLEDSPQPITSAIQQWMATR